MEIKSSSKIEYLKYFAIAAKASYSDHEKENKSSDEIQGVH